MVRQPSPVPRGRWVKCFGADPEQWLNVLASTGIALLHDEVVLARGTLFQRWVEENHAEAPPSSAPGPDALDAWLNVVGVDDFERLVVRALAAWARSTVEFPFAALKPEATVGSGNNGLHPEANFQIQGVHAFCQHERHVTAEAEALSMKPAGRSDIKVRSRHDVTRGACVEFKIYGRNDGEVVKQVIGYAMPGDTFAAVVSVDRHQRALRPVYEAGCFEGAPHERKNDAPDHVLYPAFYTDHTRDDGAPLRVWHFLVQLRDA